MTPAPAIAARVLRVTGVVQGVGFRPFVHRIAVSHALSGWVRNSAGAVEIYVEGRDDQLTAFQRELHTGAPSVSVIDAVDVVTADPTGTRDFRIVASADALGTRRVSIDLGTCAECESELFDIVNRRFAYPFITCTNCGPRYTIVDELPFDRERTTMAEFALCEPCAAEYAAAGDRRHHAETVACATCGPQLWLTDASGLECSRGADAIRDAAARICAGDIVAVRGIGGFHLACDASDDATVRRLRDRKHRDAKPFAIMVRTLGQARSLVELSREERQLLMGPERPVVLLRKRIGAPIAEGVSPQLDRVGVMLAYSPLHHLLLQAVGRPLVMTSGNRSDEPIAMGNAEAFERLGGIADAFLLHDREILSRIDDSVARVVDGSTVLLRRARGYAPRAIALPIASPRPLIAVGPHLKNTFTLVEGNVAYVSPHLGDLDSVEGLAHFRETLSRYERLFRIAPEIAVRDLHPGYLSSRLAAELGLSRTIVVQHHHAHIAAVAAEHRVTTPVVGLAFDGAGLGDDGNVWGAEVLVADLTQYRRAAQLRYAPLPGGDLAAREPWRAALGYLSLEPAASDAFALAFRHVSASDRAIAQRQIERRLNAPLASSMGRLFDAAAAVLGIRSRSSYEGHAAMELEAFAGSRVGEPLPFPVSEHEGRLVLDPIPLLAALGELRQRNVDLASLAARFHESVAHAAAAVATVVADGAGLNVIALGGGSFQNGRLLSSLRALLLRRGLRVLVPRLLGPNDGAISFGQAAVAAALLARNGPTLSAAES